MILKENIEAQYISEISDITAENIASKPASDAKAVLKYRMFKLIDANVTELFKTTDKTENFKNSNKPFYKVYCDEKPGKENNDVVLAGVTSEFINDVNNNFVTNSLGEKSKRFILAILQNHAYGKADSSQSIEAFVKSKFYFYEENIRSDRNISKIIEIKKNSNESLPASCFFYFKTHKLAPDKINTLSRLSFSDIIVNAKADSIENPRYPHLLVFGNPKGVLRFSNPNGDDFNVLKDSDFKKAAEITIQVYNEPKPGQSSNKENTGNIPDVYKIGENYKKGYFLPTGEEEIYPLQSKKEGMPCIDLEGPVGSQRVHFDICPFFTLVTSKGNFSFIKPEQNSNEESNEEGEVSPAQKSRDVFSNEVLNAFSNYAQKTSYVGGKEVLIRDAKRFYRWVALLSLLETFDYSSFENVRRVNQDSEKYQSNKIKKTDYCQRVIADSDVTNKINDALSAFENKQKKEQIDEVNNIILFIKELLRKNTVFEAASLISSKRGKQEFGYINAGKSFSINTIADYLLIIKERGELGENGQEINKLNIISDDGEFSKERIKFLLSEYAAQTSVINENFIRNKIKSILVERYHNKPILKESDGSADVPTKLEELINMNDGSIKETKAKALWENLDEFEKPDYINLINSKLPDDSEDKLTADSNSLKFIELLKIYAGELIKDKNNKPKETASKDIEKPKQAEPVAAPPPPPAPKKPQKIIQDANEKQAEVDYGYVGTFLRASVAITARKKETVTKEGEAATQKDVQEARIRRAIRKMLIKEEESSPGAEQVVSDAIDQALGSPPAESVPNSDELKAGTVEEVISDADLLNKLLSDISIIFANTVWAIFCKFSNPNQALYAVCIQDPGNNFTGMTFNKAGISVLGQTKNELLGKVKDLLNTNLTITEFAVERIILEAIKTSEEYGPADAQLKTGDLESAFDTDSSGKGDIKYRKLAQLFKEKRFNDTEFVSSMSLIKNYMTDSNMLYDILMVDTNAKGVLQTETKSIMRNAKASDPIAYKNAINTFNSSLSDTLRPGEKVTFQIVKKKGASKDFAFKSGNKKHERALNANASSFTDVLSNFLGESGLTGLQASARPSISASSGEDSIPILPEFGKSITIPAEAKYYTANINNKRSNNENIGMKAAISGGKFKGFYILPMLNEKQFYAVLLDYWTKGLKNKRKIRDSVRKNLSNVKQSYVTYKSNYKRFIERDMFKLLNDKRMTKELRDFKSQYQDIVRGVYPENSEYFYFSSTKVSQEIPGGARRLKRREKDTTETLDRKTNMYYIHSPGVMADPYDDFIRKIIIGCTNSNSAAENIQDEQVKIYENIFNRHQLLYKVYLKNKLRENIESKTKYKKKERIKNKIRNLLNEDYKEGDTMISNLGDIAKMFKSQAPPKKTAPPKQASSDPKKEKENEEEVSTHAQLQGTSSPKEDNSENLDQDRTQAIEDAIPREELQGLAAPVGDTIGSIPWIKRELEGLSGIHLGIDFASVGGTSVLVSSDGTVDFAGWQDPDDRSAGAGQYVRVDHGDYYTYYMHLSQIDAKVGDIIDQGEPIGLSGNTGNVVGKYGGYHLHFEIRRKEGGTSVKDVYTTLNWMIANKDRLNFTSKAFEDLDVIENWMNEDGPLKDNDTKNHFIIGSNRPQPADEYNWKQGHYMPSGTKYNPTQ